MAPKILTPAVYARALLMAGVDLLDEPDGPMDDAVLAQYRVGIYIGCDFAGEVHYVGSVCRPDQEGGLLKRPSEHDRDRRGAWRSIWGVPLRETTPRALVHAIEGDLIDYLRPRHNLKRHAPISLAQRDVLRLAARELDTLRHADMP
ncbi:hypothetical protein [Deinococcus soli (ex Cha et al. 2016)]|uniref:Uncharacterized protein n=2 Tax=Deinococcus soli (ex Cha et al. 2016) TaxID=1309411 RepID=A0ACC6KHH1_9DEIO|nr:hypothetical protein [Deinococcus soli (ex Cha et al. 2016)]MDR6218760.1 hypothetical protein [Deinococcus soli (ex Cha et al. 2016)]MDR6328557.1 hypothetical protein [Deinococcus soli (ex Cha et al. 2016)]MDR6751956.1 hypothetical protein [Deinococcus soli (ex Cha et al. 2016)]